MTIKAESLEYFKDRETWRAWLEQHFEEATGVWLLFPRKSSGKVSVNYNDAVEEALCFGWIDSIIKTHDELHYKQRFSPRRKRSKYSQPNIERLRWLRANKLIHQSMCDEVDALLLEPFVFPGDIISMIKKDKTVWENYSACSDSYKRIRIAYIDSARDRPEEFRKRLANFIARTRENKLIIGHGGVDRYY